MHAEIWKSVTNLALIEQTLNSERYVVRRRTHHLPAISRPKPSFLPQSLKKENSNMAHRRERPKPVQEATNDMGGLSERRGTAKGTTEEGPQEQQTRGTRTSRVIGYACREGRPVAPSQDTNTNPLIISNALLFFTLVAACYHSRTHPTGTAEGKGRKPTRRRRTSWGERLRVG